MSQLILTFLGLSVVFTVVFLVAVLLGLFKKKNMPKWRLKPDERGTYTLEKWHPDVGMYLAETVRVTREQAYEQIQLLEGEALYYKQTR